MLVICLVKCVELGFFSLLYAYICGIRLFSYLNVIPCLFAEKMEISLYLFVVGLWI